VGYFVYTNTAPDVAVFVQMTVSGKGTAYDVCIVSPRCSSAKNRTPR